jgi:hypothetical protein
MSSVLNGIPQPLTIDAGSIFIFGAILAADAPLDLRRPAEHELTLESHPELTVLIENAKRSGIFGDCGGMKAFRADYLGRPVAVGLRGKPDSMSCTDALVLTNEDSILARTLLLFGLNIRVKDATVDEVIALIQSAGAAGDRSDETASPMLSVTVGDERARTIGDVLEALRKSLIELFPEETVFVVEGEHSDDALGLPPGSRWCCEIRRLGGYATSGDVVSDVEAALPLYGLLHGDEGWAYVPAGHAVDELKCFWGSRDYVAVLAQESGVLVLNLEERRDQDRVTARARSLELSGLTMPHLELASSIAGIEHGGLFALQRSLLRLLAARELESKLFGASKSVTPPRRDRLWLLGWFRALLGGVPALFRVLYRGPQSRFYKDLLRVSGRGVSELANLQSFMDERLGATPLVQRLYRAADLVDIELRDKRLTALNWLVAFLTALTIAIGVLELVLN